MSFLVAYADDYLVDFEYRSEAERYYEEMQKWLHKYGLEIETIKNRIREICERKGRGGTRDF